MKKINSKSNMNKTYNYLPHNFLAEKIILNCILTTQESIYLIFKNLSFETFYFKNHQELFKIMLFMYKNNYSIDIITLTAFLQENGLIRKIGGLRVLIELINQVPNIFHLNEYIRLIKDKFLRRSLIKFGYKIINSSYVMNLPIKHILNECEQQLFKLTNEFKPNTLSTTTSLVYDIFLELKKKAIKPYGPGLTSGFYCLDSITQGFQNSDLIILAGRPSIGKTAFSLTIVLNSIKFSKLPVLFFSLEMSKEQIIYRLLSMETNISQLKLRSGKLRKTDWIKLNKIIKIISKLPIFIDDDCDFSIQKLRSKVKTILLQYEKIGLIIIDYLQLIRNFIQKNGNRVQELSQITRSLKVIAREFNVPIIALSQLSRNVENRNDKKPILSDLRESGSLEQDADVVLILYPNDQMILNSDSIKIINLIIAKQRNGPTGTIQLTFDNKRTKYFDL